MSTETNFSGTRFQYWENNVHPRYHAGVWSTVDFIFLTEVRELWVEGVTVKVAESVVIRVELKMYPDSVLLSMMESCYDRTQTYSISSHSGTETNLYSWLLQFPDPYVNFLLQISRIVIVECDDRGVWVDLLVSNSDPHNHGRHMVRNNTQKNPTKLLQSQSHLHFVGHLGGTHTVLAQNVNCGHPGWGSRWGLVCLFV